MSIWQKIFGGGKTSTPDLAAPSSTPATELGQANINEMMIDAAATVMAYKRNGWFEILRDGSGEVNGFWLGHPQSPEREQSFLKMAASSEKLDEATFISISLGDYRVVPNNHEKKGGCFVMIGTARAPTETVLPLESFRWRKGEPNPASKRVTRFRYENVLSGVNFLCPTCSLPNTCHDSNISDIVGALVKCGHCGNVCHVPTGYKTQADISGLAVRGGICVPISEFGDWFLAHPSFSAADAELYGSYGLWGFCARCHHRYASTVLVMLPTVGLFKGVVFNAKSNESAHDFKALADKRCGGCGHPNLIALMVGVPQYIRNAAGEFLPLTRSIDTRRLSVPPEFDRAGGKIHLEATFSEHPREKLLDICRALPIEQLDFYQPGATAEMDYAATVSMLTAIYLAGKDKPREYGDVVIPRLIAQLERHDPKNVNVLIGTHLEEFGMELINGGRPYEALRCLTILKSTIFGRAVIDRVSMYTFTALYNIANRTKAAADIRAALQQGDALSAEGREHFAAVIANLRKMKSD